MKKIYLVSIICFLFTQTHFAQQRFDKWWEEVENLELEGKSDNAFEKALKIKRKADRKENPQQFLKAFLYVSKYKLILKKNSQEEVYKDFLDEIESQNTPNQQVLYSFLAESLNDYYKENRYRINKRTKIDTVSNDFLSWSKDDFENKVMGYYQKSLQHEKKLIKTPLKDFTEILKYGENYNNYRSTLYDLLANRYFSFLKYEHYNSQQEEVYFIKDSSFFSSPEDFISIDFSTYEDRTHKIETLQIYQDLTRLHLQQKDSLSLVMTTLERFEYLKNKGSYSNSGELFKESLQNLLKRKTSKIGKAWIAYKLAQFYYQNANKYKTPDYLEKSISLIKNIKSTVPNSTPGIGALQLEKAIISSQLNIKTKQKPLPNRKFRALVNFKNTDSLYLNIYKISSQTIKRKINDTDSIVRDLYKNAKPFQQQQFKLPKIENHFSYSTELLLDELPVGNYLLLFNKSKKIDFKEDNYQYQNIQVTNLSYTNFDFNEDQQLYITDRTTGKPIKDVKVILDDKPSKIYFSDENGLLKIHYSTNNYYQRKKITLNYKGDTLKSNLNFRRTYSSSGDLNEKEPEIRSFLLTDRAIYRPGQTIYFKGILSYQSKSERKVVPSERVYVELYDANYDLVDSLSLTTNEFGSVQGEFKIPKSVLTGNFKLKLEENFQEDSYYTDFYFNNTYKNIQVEEYKRPKFEVEFKDIDSTYVVNDSIQLKGISKAFFGGNITNARVSYTIDRQQDYNYWYSYQYNRSAERIATGKTTTDEKGNFETDFKAIPNKAIDSTTTPIFTYKIEATVTDINGETQTAEQSIRIGYHATEIHIQSPHQPIIGEKRELKILAKDLNNLASKAEGELKIYKYIKPDRILVNRSWMAPEIQQIPKEEFIKHFPYTVYDSLDLKENWPKKLITTIPLEIDSVATIQLDNYSEDLKTGEYYLKFKGIGKLGFKVEASKALKINNPNDKLDQKEKEFISYTYDLKETNENHTVTLHFTSSLDSLPLLLNIAFDDQLVEQKNIQLNKCENSISYVIPNKTENVHLEYTFNQLGYYFTKKESIGIPQPEEINKNLEFEVISFKNKLEPGKQETWQLKVIDHEKKPANAEVLASMYDASLDEFVSHNWHAQLYKKPYSYKNNGLPNSSIQINNFYSINFINQNYNQSNYYSYPIRYSVFKNFGYSFINAINTNKLFLNYLVIETENKEHKKGYINGTVLDEQGIPIPAANVIIKGTTTGTTTNFDGNYSIKANENDFLVISALGFSSVEKRADQTKLIILKADSANLDEVVITGFDNSEKRLFTGANSTISEEDNYYRGNVYQKLFTESSGVESTNDSHYFYSKRITLRGVGSIDGNAEPLYVIDGVPISENEFKELATQNITSIKVLKDASATALYGSRAANGVIIITTKAAEEELQQIETRTNLKETAFFFPQLKTNKKGEVIFEFETPEALTRWNFQAFAHDKNLHQAKLDLTTITQKDLNIIPNFPRFFRSKDTVIISAKVNNLSKKVLTGVIQLEFTDEVTQQKIKLVADKNSIKNFRMMPKGNTEVSWKLVIPENLLAVRYRIVAKAGNFSDGEENIIPVLSNRIFITETLPIWVNPNEKKGVTFNNLKNNNSTTLKNHQLVFEYTSNPAWTSLQALPYLIEYPYDCAEQTFAKVYANYITTVILEKNPEIKKTLQQWKENKTELSAFNKNEELKQIALQETPWLKDTESEEEQQKRLAQLLDIQETKMRTQQAFTKLSALQLSSGAFPWFNGGRANRSISLHLLKGMGRLLSISPELEKNETFDDITTNLIIYLDNEFLKNDRFKETDSFNTSEINYIYARSFFYGFKDENFETYKEKLFSEIEKNWITLPIQTKMTLAVIAQRYEKKKLARTMLESLKENAVIDSEYGMYWKEVVSSRYWYNAPIATQTLAIEAFAEIDKDQETINQLKTWLLRNKKTEAWKSTKATTEAIYALMIQGDQEFINAKMPKMPKIKIGNEKLNLETEGKAGYVKKSFPAEKITAEIANIEIKNNSASPQYGAYYWQYFEESDQVQGNNQQELSIQKEIFKKEESNKGSTLIPLNKSNLKIGDLVTVRLIIKAEEKFSFMHLKDMRAAGLEPIDVISAYKWQDGLGYYQSTKDVATHFFFDEISKGTYVFEYDLRVNNPGNFSNGITQLQSMYAPEFKVQSKGSRIELIKQ
ncbi:carboxypeptidase-like regulatory domain-containing protein [Mesonia aestuariivivens]|uniref:Carboxypeptidase-like regulatory domain-containing protein n=1 Tax=Mesonia aestuariivivens TaxID=2796128 RepID=A0ABS6W3W7_9FLAO|nr:carboxypeptidase-like regulatory domain-containing protein [Mesonia aestuariivivens]MBW2962237.1 carboxypeptidase-like regulatory domain-containing protein [Mesonia aestuariivivens]